MRDSEKERSSTREGGGGSERKREGGTEVKAVVGMGREVEVVRGREVDGWQQVYKGQEDNNLDKPPINKTFLWE